MKIFISFAIALAGTIGLWMIKPDALHRSCSCAGLSCSCTISCKDNGESPSCNCSTFSCNCVCNPSSAVSNDNPLPTMDIGQEENSKKIEAYFRKNGSAAYISIANGVKTLRESIKSGNGVLYRSTATIVDNEYNRLPVAGRQAYESWIASTFK